MGFVSPISSFISSTKAQQSHTRIDGLNILIFIFFWPRCRIRWCSASILAAGLICREAKREKKLVIWVFVSHSSFSNSLSFLSFRALRMLFAWTWSGSAFLPCPTLPWSCGQDSKLIYSLNFVLFHPPSSFRMYVLKCSCWSHERTLQHFKL